MRPGLRVLLLEDDEAVAFAISDFLDHAGCAVTAARDTDAGLDVLATERFDLLIADLRLAGTDNIDGLDVAHLAIDRARVGAAIVLTAYSYDSTIERAAKLGVAAVLRKPLPLRELAALITSLDPHQPI